MPWFATASRPPGPRITTSVDMKTSRARVQLPIILGITHQAPSYGHGLRHGGIAAGRHNIGHPAP